MTETILITIGLGFDLFGAFLIIIPELAKKKNPIGPETREMIPMQKNHLREYGLFALMIGFVLQILGNSLR